MADDAKLIEGLREKQFIDERNIYYAGAANKMDAGVLFGALGGIGSALASMVYLCVSGDELIITKLDLNALLFRRRLSELSVEKLKTGLMGGKLVFRCDGKKLSFDCSNDFARALAPLVGMKL
ncbi:MAG: hypothetical protein Q4C01_03325 [Clostridia bacterium]|nr:hypothetical protein [Clostridia bacterium]